MAAMQSVMVEEKEREEKEVKEVKEGNLEEDSEDVMEVSSDNESGEVKNPEAPRKASASQSFGWRDFFTGEKNEEKETKNGVYDGKREDEEKFDEENAEMYENEKSNENGEGNGGDEADKDEKESEQSDDKNDEERKEEDSRSGEEKEDKEASEIGRISHDGSKDASQLKLVREPLLEAMWQLGQSKHELSEDIDDSKSVSQSFRDIEDCGIKLSSNYFSTVEWDPTRGLKKERDGSNFPRTKNRIRKSTTYFFISL